MKEFEQRELIKKNKVKRINKSSTRRNKIFLTTFKFVDVVLQSFSTDNVDVFTSAFISVNTITSIDTINSVNTIISFNITITSIFTVSQFSTNTIFTTSITITSISAKKKKTI